MPTPRPSQALAASLVVLLVAIVVAPVPEAAGGVPWPAGGLLLRGTVVTMDDAGTIVDDGRVLVRLERIVAVWSGDTPPVGVDPTGAEIVDLGPDAAIYPGLINLHGHPAFHVLPLWLPPSSDVRPEDGRPTGLEPYANRYQWNDASDPVAEYRRIVAAPRGFVGNALALDAEMVKWAEIMSALGGQTTFEGVHDRHADVDHSLVRNVDYGAFCKYGVPCVDPVSSRVASIMDVPFGSVDHGSIWLPLAVGQTEAWLVHLAEGVRDADRPAGDNVSSRAEFDHLVGLGLLAEETVILHGIALEARDFALMRAAPPIGLGESDGLGTRLVWAPLSNLVLYGKTVKVHEALRADVLVTLGTDWTPSGTRSLLHELKVADLALRDPDITGARDPLRLPIATAGAEAKLDEQLVRMATSNGAKAVRAYDKIGSVEAGKLADLIVVTKPARSPTGGMPDTPYRRLIDATERDVRLVLVGGRPIAGDVDVMARLKPGDHEVVTSARGGYSKAIDVTDESLPNGTQTLAQIEDALGDALTALGGDSPPAGGGPTPDTNTWSWLKARLDGGIHAGKTDAEFALVMAQRFGRVADGRINVEAIALNPLLMEDDDFLFAAFAAATDATPPYGAYAANHNHVQPDGNPLAPSAHAERWYAAGP